MRTPLTASEVAAVFDVKPFTVGRWVRAGRLAPVKRVGAGPKAAYLFDPAAVEHLRRLRAGETGDVLDRVDVQAAGDDPVEDRNAATRAAWLDAIRYVTARTPGRTFHSGQIRALVPDDAHSPASGALITALVRQRVIEHTGDYAESGDTTNRHGSTPCKVYRLVGVLP